ncbi:eCIS core domain-containing protein [Cellulomonas palmilytica]|uniref:eCIS core domain-containing protein n=1 Tax=Cellulomonas palmilytica TaxID=2608402 RepID=UPI001F318BF8|nr:DUF4157 domain-containing protein [Cellulomonas palmilytica]UJP40599.1 DUF4157 domain-containing protein [Cellulomonas palmilytica]
MDQHVEQHATRQSSSPTDGAATEQTTTSPSRPAPVAGLVVGHADDQAEVAAESHATAALARLRRFGEAPPSAPAAHRPPRHAEVGRAGGAVSSGRSHEISAELGQGAPLPSTVRGRMEAGFGTSLDHVRVHDDAAAARHSAALGAQAFTVGSDVFLGGSVDPASPRGEHVLAHEIAHVLHEGGTPRTPVRRNPGDDDEDVAPVERTAAEIVEAASKVTDKIGQIGSATRALSDAAGLLWTGLSAAPVGTVKGYWVSSDGNRRYRPPSFKPTWNVTQSNFESGPPPKRPHKDNWATNAHLTITD